MEERTYHRSVRERSPLAVSAHSGGSARQIEALAMPPLPEEVQLLYERVERLAEQSSIAEQLQRENDELRIEVRELRGEVRALRRENMTLRSKDRADASDMVCRHAGVSRSSLRLRRSLCCSRHRGCARCAARSQAVTDSILTALHESELAQQTNREALIALRRHHAAQLAERDIEIARLRYATCPTPTPPRAVPALRSAGASLSPRSFPRRTTTRGGSSDVFSRVSTMPGTKEMHTHGPQTPTILSQGPATSVHISMPPMAASPAGFRSTRMVDSEGWVGGGLSS